MYGENGGQLRAELTALLHQHRIQHRLGGQGLYTVPESTTVDERKNLGEQIGRYRQAVLVWCLQAVRGANPRIDLEGTTGRHRGPAEELRFRLEAAITKSTACLPPLEELAAEQTLPMVETWRRVARAAALGEHDFDAGIGYDRLSDAQCKTVLKDAAEVARAIVALDRRYSNIPGWHSLKDRGRLGRAAELCAVFAGDDEPDYTVDLRGWRPAPTSIDGPALPGITGVLQAEHNLLVHLGKFPDAHSLRVVLDSQRIVSRAASGLTEPNDPQRAAKWRVRESTYHRLIHETRDLGGELGNGRLAAGQGSLVATRIQRLLAADVADPTPLRQLDPLFARVDDQISQIIEHGAKERLYFLRVPFPHVDERAAGLVKPTRERYIPITSPVGANLIAIARTDPPQTDRDEATPGCRSEPGRLRGCRRPPTQQPGQSWRNRGVIAGKPTAK
jgi:hypothetical protein